MRYCQCPTYCKHASAVDEEFGYVECIEAHLSSGTHAVHKGHCAVWGIFQPKRNADTMLVRNATVGNS